MKVLIVVASSSGPTARWADTVADGMRDGGAEVALVRAGGAGDRRFDGLDLLVLAVPTHGRTADRRLARALLRRRALGDTVPHAVREWLGAVRTEVGAAARPPVAVVDLRAEVAGRWAGVAVRAVERTLRRAGFRVLTGTSFAVGEVVGPILAVELAHARAWGQHLATRSSGRTPAL